MLIVFYATAGRGETTEIDNNNEPYVIMPLRLNAVFIELSISYDTLLLYLLSKSDEELPSVLSVSYGMLYYP